MSSAIAQHLLSRGILGKDAIVDATDAALHWNGAFDNALLDAGAMTEDDLLRVMSEISGFRSVNLRDYEPNPSVTEFLPQATAQAHNIVPLSHDGTTLHVASSFPVRGAAIATLARKIGFSIVTWVAIDIRVREWQSFLYEIPLTPRMVRLLERLSPTMDAPAPSAVETESVIAPALTPRRMAVRHRVDSSPEAPAPPAASLDSSAPTDPLVDTSAKPPAPKPSAPKPSAPSTPSVGVVAEVESLSSEAVERIAEDVLTEPSRKPEPIILGPATSLDSAMPVVTLHKAGSAVRTRTVTSSSVAIRAPAQTGRSSAVPSRSDEDTSFVPIRTESSVVPRRVRLSPPAAPAPSASGASSFEPIAAVSRPMSRSLAEPLAEPPPAVASHPESAPLPRTRPSLVPQVPPVVVPPRRGSALDSASAPTRPPSTPAVQTPLDNAAVEPLPGAPRPPEFGTSRLASPPPRANFDFDDLVAPPVSTPKKVPPASGRKSSPELAPTLVAATGDKLVIAAPIQSPPTSIRVAEQAPVAAPTSAAAPPEASPLRMAEERSAVKPVAASSPAEPSAPAAVPSMPTRGPPGADTWTREQAIEALQRASKDRQALVATILGYGLQTFDCVAAFVVKKEQVVGWDASGDCDRELLKSARIPLEVHSVFQTTVATGAKYIGPMPVDEGSVQLLGALGRSPLSMILWPVEVRGRTIALIYGDTQQREPDQLKLADFALFCAGLPDALQAFLVSRKREATATEANVTPPPPPTSATPSPLPTSTPAGRARADAIPKIAPVSAVPPPRESAPRPASAADVLESPEGERWYEVLLALVISTDPTQRAMARAQLVKAPAASAVALSRAFPGPTQFPVTVVSHLPDADELGPVPGALARLGRHGAKVLIPLLNSTNSETRYFAFLSAGKLMTRELASIVVAAFFDDSNEVASAARAVASAHRHLSPFSSALPALRKEMQAGTGTRRAYAARALGALRDVQSVGGLIDLLRSSNVEEVEAAAAALQEITRAGLGLDADAWASWWVTAKPRRRAEWLLDALENEDVDVRQAAFADLVTAFPNTHGYAADAPLEERAAALVSWRETVARTRIDV